jgi:muramidase (phage lysozyme)
MNPEDLKQRALKFIGSSSGIRFGSFGAPITRRISLVPRRSVPQQIVSKFKPSDADDGITTTQRDISSLGKVTLNLEQTKNNLERIVQVISEDYKNTQEQNKKEAEEYRKRIANRGRIFGKKELGDNKTDIIGGIKKYVGSFFSGTGGAIRSLALFNLLQGVLSGDPSKIIGPLLGIGATYLPAIGGIIGLSLAKSLGKRLLGFGGAASAAAPAASAASAAGGGSALGKFGRFAGRAGLVAGGIGLASSLFNQNRTEDQTQNRLEELTQQQKAAVEPGNIVPLPQDDLKRFESLNNKFEKALDFLLAKQKETPTQRTSSGGGGGGGGSGGQIMSGPAPGEINALMSAISGAEGGLESVNKIGPVAGLSQMTIDDAIAKVEQLKAQGKTSGAMGNMQQMSEFLRGRAVDAGLDPSTALFNQENQYKINRAYLASLFSGGEQEVVNLIRSGKIADVVNKLKGVWPSLPGGSQENVHTSDFYRRFQTFLGQTSSSGTAPIAPVLPSPSSPVRRNIPAPQSATPTIVPMVVPQQSSSQPTSASSESNDIAPAFSTTYPENFLALYSKLIYQIV